MDGPALPPDLRDALLRIKAECDSELHRIADWWLTHIQRAEGGYHGQIGLDGQPDPSVPVSGVLMTRILWFFSAAAETTGREDLLTAANRAADWLQTVFVDRNHGGIVWASTPEGQIANGRKQAYGQAFGVYALARHARTTGAETSLRTAMSIFEHMEHHFRVPALGGYGEAYARDWSPIDDIRLSEKDAFSPKTMNTHLHILEAYAELLRATGLDAVRGALEHLLDVFLERIVHPSGTHLQLFLSEDWQDESAAVSFGHDIEAAWLLHDAAAALGNVSLQVRINAACLALSRAVLTSGTGSDGGVYNERHIADGRIDTSRIWWVQAEALVGFLDACVLSRDADFARAALNTWSLIKATIIAPEGEWRSNSMLDGTCDAWWAGPWKACYHNGRAMIEASRLVSLLTI
ncbi:MAG: AGE family epimerase/isomerase [Hyphomonas sp.]|nr:AGE family epimerase/isomerase [Hyphomonas sp.]